MKARLLPISLTLARAGAHKIPPVTKAFRCIMSIVVYVTRRANPLDEGDRKFLRPNGEQPSRATQICLSRPPSEPGFPTRAKYAVWNSYPGGYSVWFTLPDGNIEVDTPDTLILKKLSAIGPAGFSTRCIGDR